MLTLTRTLWYLKELGIRPRKTLGQNFLIDPNIVQKSLIMAELRPQDVVVEVGSGLGTLTQELLAKVAEVYAVECDGRLCDHLQKTLEKEWGSRFHLLHEDAVKFPIAQKPPCEEYKIVANLPYAISTPWMDAVLSQEILPSRIVVLLQRETTERFFAKVGTKSMGPIAIFLQSAYDLEEMHPVSRKCFFPEPAVDSVLLSMSRKEAPIFFLKEKKSMIRRLFTERRKQMKHLALKYLPPSIANAWLSFLCSHDSSDKIRSEEVPMELWQYFMADDPRL
ncbi:MAG: 16S rRNA (adenine(1518)-N(6)/adenine(1519)-N(6))-dimethyltransferase RsmA [Puniceicoccales bacterium]|jgi:16S rRNA (adenine1518-N6/adenine1519-N6)-dimethyltransferase|nr:16S rRNA (adenine(1518)-N(6)/adenine(1519)-N(6))-dimethyltransferase RsmA [Puniceicoccales bacterium]